MNNPDKIHRSVSDGERIPSSTPTTSGSAARASCRGARGTPSWSAGRARSSAATSRRSCASGSIWVSTGRTRSRCTTTPRSPAGSTRPWICRSSTPGLKKTLDSSGRLRDVNTAVVAGLRIYARF